ncbi:MAG: hypothetical protein R3212_11425 [Xanthomonadales bacterium]|nr:hypothetical protein [Xanthomonadales bacterium]
MNKLIVAALLVFAAPVHAAESSADLATILDENAQAHGGSAYAAIETVRHRLLIKEPTFQVEGTYTATRDGRMRIDIYAGGQRVFAEGLDGDCGWAWQPSADGGEPMIEPCVDEKETAALRHGTQMPGHFFTLKDVGERGAKLELIGEEVTDAGAYWQVRVTLPDGFERDYFIDQETKLIAMARDQRAFHPGIDPVEITVESRYSNPRTIDGVLRYMKQENTNAVTGEWLGTTTVLTIEHNVEIPEGMFEPGWDAPDSPRP